MRNLNITELYFMLLGGFSFWKFVGLFLWALVGAYILVQMHNNTREPLSARTPIKFTWGFWFRDNVRRVVFTGVMIIVVIRFSIEITGRPINEFWALVIGMSSDGLALFLNKFNLVKLIGTVKGPDQTGLPVQVKETPDGYEVNESGNTKQ